MSRRVSRILLYVAVLLPVYVLAYMLAEFVCHK